MRVRIIDTDSRLGIKKNEIYQACSYPYDPNKVILLSREPDGYDPSCTQYRNEIEVLDDASLRISSASSCILKHMPSPSSPDFAFRFSTSSTSFSVASVIAQNPVFSCLVVIFIKLNANELAR